MSDNSIPLKQCPRCKQFYPLTKDYFRVCKREKNGLTHACRKCLKKQDLEYLDRNREKNKAAGKARYHAKTIEYKKYKEDHKERIKKQKRDYRKAHPEQTKKNKRDSNKRHPKSSQARVKRYNEKHPEIARLRTRISQMRRRVKMGNFERSDLMAMYEDQEHRCAYCGITLYWSIPNDIHVDHIKPVTKGGTNDIDNLALTCADCNLSKHDLELSDWIATRGW
jgi:hypothetical protein